MSPFPKAFAAALSLLICLASAGTATAQIGVTESIVQLPESGLPDGVLVSAGTRVDNLGGFNINLNVGSGLASNLDALAAFQRAADRWMSRFSDPITININANLADLGGGGVIGSTTSTMVQGSYSTIRNAMVADAASDPGDIIVQSLPTASQFSAVVPSGFTLSPNITLTSANAKALGFDTGTGSDATITFNSRFAFDYDNRNGVTPGTIDFESVAAHEIGHALGFVSAVDNVDFLLASGRTGAISVNPLDLFRFQNDVAGRDPSTTSEFTNDPRFLAPGGDAITDILTNEYRMSTGSFTGDGRQASHWKDDDLSGNYIGVMDPTVAFGFVAQNTDADYRALSLIGYNLTAAVPEPSALAMAGLGLVSVALMRWRRARA